jgi:hypothetical protein
VTYVYPTTGSSGGATVVTIGGTGFLAGATVSIGGVVSNVTVVNSAAITATTLPHAVGAVDVVVTNPGGQHSSLTGGFTYAAFSITDILPTTGPATGATRITIRGSGFERGATVDLDGMATAVTVVNSTTISGLTAAHIGGPVDVVVTNPGGERTRLAGGFTYDPILVPPDEYTVTLTADSACVALPAQLRTRTYRATVAPVSAGTLTPLKATLSGASFWGGDDSFWIHTTGNRVVFEFDTVDVFYPAIVEELGPNRYFAVQGTATVSLDEPLSTILASFSGYMEYCELKSPLGIFYDCRPEKAVASAFCGSKAHQLTVSRR